MKVDQLYVWAEKGHPLPLQETTKRILPPQFDINYLEKKMVNVN